MTPTTSRQAAPATEQDDDDMMLILADETACAAYRLGHCVGREEASAEVSWECFAWGLMLGGLTAFVAFMVAWRIL